MATVVSLLGYGKTGKTTFGERLIRHAVADGFTVAAIKTGRLGDATGHSQRGAPPRRRADPPGYQPDSNRFRAAGAEPVVFWTEWGARVEGTEGMASLEPVPGRDEFGSRWGSRLPAELLGALLHRDLLLVEGRLLPKAIIVQTRRKADGAVKYHPQIGEYLIRGEESFPGVIEAILDQIKEAMSDDGQAGS